MTRKIGITDTILRDAHQSLMATRMRIEDMLPVLDQLDEAGFASLECWGGATFDACIRFLDEDPWDRLRTLKKHLKKTPLQMLLRGQNILGYRHYADDVVEKFVEKSAENGIDIFRIFDALNDVRNLEASLNAVKKTGKEAQMTICYTISDAHTIDYYKELAAKMQEMGADSICVKDMAGILTPARGIELVRALKEVITVPIVVHTHCTSGIAQLTYQAVIEAGADRIDTALSPLSDHFRVIKDKYIKDGTLNPKMLTPDPRALLYQVPGGMLSNMYSQLTQAGATDKYEEVLKEVPKVRADLGYPPLVTPMSQMVGTQATMNVLTGQRYKVVSNEVKSYLLGSYGQSPVPIQESFRRSIIGDQEVISDRPANHLPPEFETLKAELGDLARSDEDVLTYALFPKVGKEFLLKKNGQWQKPSEIVKIFATVK